MNVHFLWVLGQFGILLEISGALYIAAASVSLHKKIERLFVGIWGLRELPRIVESIQNQARSDITGFLLLAAGLLMQFIGNFSAV